MTTVRVSASTDCTTASRIVDLTTMPFWTMRDGPGGLTSALGGVQHPASSKGATKDRRVVFAGSRVLKLMPSEDQVAVHSAKYTRRRCEVSGDTPHPAGLYKKGAKSRFSNRAPRRVRRPRSTSTPSWPACSSRARSRRHCHPDRVTTKQRTLPEIGDDVLKTTFGAKRSIDAMLIICRSPSPPAPISCRALAPLFYA